MRRLNIEAPKFEGPEKKLEIILSEPQADLRSNADGRWNRVVNSSGAEIISSKSNSYLDAYLLSESSLFVWADRILMITCGQTTLLNSIPEILGIVDKQNVAQVFYERKNFMYPQDQPSDFEDDVAYMERYFPGKSYRLGPANDDHVHVFYSSHDVAAAEQDATLQVLMQDLDPAVSALYRRGGALTKEQVFHDSGLDRIFPGMDTDSHLFAPYGYSINGILDNWYFTVHVTPQPDGSYASFETNVLENDFSEVVARVLSLFNPQRFSLVLTTSMDEQCLDLHPTVNSSVTGYNATEKSLYEFDCGYTVTFFNYVMKWDDG